MNLWQEFLNDPVIFISFTGLAIVIGLCLFYAVYFFFAYTVAEKSRIVEKDLLIVMFRERMLEYVITEANAKFLRWQWASVLSIHVGEFYS